MAFLFSKAQSDRYWALCKLSNIVVTRKSQIRLTNCLNLRTDFGNDWRSNESKYASASSGGFMRRLRNL